MSGARLWKLNSTVSAEKPKRHLKSPAMVHEPAWSELVVQKERKCVGGASGYEMTIVEIAESRFQIQNIGWLRIKW